MSGVWPTAKPESQGLDSGVLAEMLEHVRARQLPLHSVLIVRHGRLVLDATLHPSEPDRLHDIAAMRKSDDWAAFALALPMWAEPGSRYAYCSCNNHVLSAIISARTGGNALAFARTHLFGPLGIKDAIWPADLGAAGPPTPGSGRRSA